MAEKNLETYLSEQDMEYQKKSAKIEKRKNRFKKKFMIFGIIFAVLIVGMIGLNAITKNSTYNELKNASVNDNEAITKIASSLENVTYPDLFDKYENAYLGNKAINALNYGMLAENQYGYTTINENGETVLHSNGTENIITNEAISQINIAKDIVVFRGANKKLYSCKYDGTDKKVIVENKVGIVVVAGDFIYYVDYSKANNLYRYSINDKKIEPVIEANINKFIIIADSILYSDFSNKLMLQNIGSTTPSWTDKNVVKFYFNGDIYVQNNNKIIEFNVNNHFPKEVATDVNELLGVDENNVYYTVKNKLYAQDIGSGEKKELSYNFDYYKGVYSINGKITALGGVKE